MDICWDSDRSVEKLTKTKQTKPKYPHQRVEQKRMKVDRRGVKERSDMEKISTARISIGTFTFLRPKPDNTLSSFTLAFDKPIPKNELYQKLHKAFDGNWDGDPVKSVFVHLIEPMSLKEIRKRLHESLEEILTQNL